MISLTPGNAIFANFSAKGKGSCCSGFFFLIGVELIYHIELVSALQQSESVIHTHISTLFRFYSHIGHYTVLNRIPGAIQ